MENPVSFIVLHDNSLTSYPPAHMRSGIGFVCCSFR